MSTAQPVPSRQRLIQAMIDLVRQNGYQATRVDDVCAAAGVSKGAFFHHFTGKDDIAIAAARVWGDEANALFARLFDGITDPARQLLAYLDLRIALIDGPPYSYMCYAGTLLQEAWTSGPQVGQAAADAIRSHIDWLAPTIAAALPGPDAEARAARLSARIQATVQGALILVKTYDSPDQARAVLADLRTEVATMLGKARA